ncbi:MAG: penicillin-binding protein, beta-lactamase class C [Bacteroidetes bacterium]|nr:MAG: penicillin-binding protein, beta-lactamase class C [Bacteroidota bacterium]
MKIYARLFLLLFVIPALQLNARQPVSPGFDTLDKKLQAEFGNRFAFTVIVGDRDKILFRKAYGHADSLKKKKTTTETLFQIASVNKAITALGILCLAESGKLKLEDRIGKYIAHVPQDKETITIHQLLTHTSGFQQRYVCDGLQKTQQALDALLNDSLGAVPGTGFDYSNENYELLAIIIEKITAETYEHFTRENILDPLGMKHTFFWDERSKLDKSAQINQALPDSIFRKNWGYTGSGGIYSTTGDLYIFFSAVMNDRLITKEMRETIFKDHYKTASGLGIGYGWYINSSTDWNTRELWTRGNESWGHNAVIRWFPEKNKVIIVCTNSGEIGDKQVTGNRLVSNYIADFLWK